MRALLPLLLVGCTTHTIDSQQAVIETRGVPIVQVVIQGPGGDLVPVEHELLTKTVYEIDPQFIAMLLSLLMVFSFCAAILWVQKRGDK